MNKERLWHETDEFWELYEEVFFSPERIEKAAGEVPLLLDLAGVEPGARVLDLCCGVGRHTIELARRGFAVTGVD